jgi:hypothetical protein
VVSVGSCGCKISVTEIQAESSVWAIDENGILDDGALGWVLANDLYIKNDCGAVGIIVDDRQSLEMANPPVKCGAVIREVVANEALGV